MQVEITDHKFLAFYFELLVPPEFWSLNPNFLFFYIISISTNLQIEKGI